MTDHVKTQGFKKLSIRFSIDQKIDSIDRKSLSIDPTAMSRSNSKQNLIAFSIGRDTDSIDRKSGKHNFLKNRAILCRNSSKHSILQIKYMSMR